MSKLQLLPCPHCGATARLEIVTYPGGDRYRVGCVDCGATTWPRLISGHMAVRAWNRRSVAWVSCEERLPKIYERVLVFGEGGVSTGYINRAGDWDADVAPEFWAPLPQPPHADRIAQEGGGENGA